MARRENNIDGIRLYSDNLEAAKSKPSKTVQSYKKVETTTTTRKFVKEGTNPSQTTVTKKKTAITKGFGVPRNSINDITGNIQEKISTLQGGKDKYTYSGKLKEKSNYLYYVSGIGYVTKEGVPARDNKPKEVKVMKAKPKPTRVVGERVTIVIQNKRPEKKGGDLVENFQYYESKEFGKNNKESIVIHKRKGDPFYQSIHGQRSSSYTHGERSRATIEKAEIQSRTIETKTTSLKNQYQNKTYNTTKKTQTGAGKGNRNINESSYQRTINVEERKRNIIPKTRFEKTYTETNKKRTTSVEQKKYIPPQKKYQEKTDESYKRKPQTQSNQKAFDTEKYKRNVEQNKYQQKTEETQQTRVSQDQNMLNDPNYCPIHGYHGQGSLDDIDNYKFYESKSVTRKVNTNLKGMNTHINTNVNINRQNVINTEENINANMASMNQEQMAQAEEGYDLSKLYIATKITPVYSEMLDQQYQTHTHVCKVCGNAYDDNQMEMMQQNQANSMQEMEYDINCPIHGQLFTQ